MGASEFETLRADLAAIRSDLDTQIAKFEARVDIQLARLEAKIDEKPGYAALYQVAFGAPIALLGFTAAFLGIAKALGQF